MSLHDIDYSSGAMRYVAKSHREPEAILASYLREARSILADQPDDRPVEPHHLDDGVETLRWFWLPEEIAASAAGPAAVATGPVGWPG